MTLDRASARTGPHAPLVTRPGTATRLGQLACERSPELWFAEQAPDLGRAKALCAPCPLREACLSGALERREPAGVWGGEILVNGVVVAHKRGRGRPPRTHGPRHA